MCKNKSDLNDTQLVLILKLAENIFLYDFMMNLFVLPRQVDVLMFITDLWNTVYKWTFLFHNYKALRDVLLLHIIKTLFPSLLFFSVAFLHNINNKVSSHRYI